MALTHAQRDQIRSAMLAAVASRLDFDAAVYRALPELAPLLDGGASTEDVLIEAAADYRLALLATAQRDVGQARAA